LREKMILETPAAAAAAAPLKKAVTKSPPRARRIRQARAWWGGWTKDHKASFSSPTISSSYRNVNSSAELGTALLP
jgi:hypothetical protein